MRIDTTTARSVWFKGERGSSRSVFMIDPARIKKDASPKSPVVAMSCNTSFEELCCTEDHSSVWFKNSGLNWVKRVGKLARPVPRIRDFPLFRASSASDQPALKGSI